MDHQKCNLEHLTFFAFVLVPNKTQNLSNGDKRDDRGTHIESESIEGLLVWV
jgi:hypothetical protein